jgi:F-type H+-transporting ATPase subunit alpha
MSIKPEEITSAIKKQIQNLNITTEMQEVGTVLQIGDGIARVHGLNSAMSGELLLFPENTYGLVPMSATPTESVSKLSTRP